jgi:hypothetical protein
MGLMLAFGCRIVDIEGNNSAVLGYNKNYGKNGCSKYAFFVI